MSKTAKIWNFVFKIDQKLVKNLKFQLKIDKKISKRMKFSLKIDQKIGKIWNFCRNFTENKRKIWNFCLNYKQTICTSVTWRWALTPSPRDKKWRFGRPSSPSWRAYTFWTGLSGRSLIANLLLNGYCLYVQKKVYMYKQ